MLLSLHIENYALIRKLDIPFETGLSVITGETGAGKSIILGALNLILGNRADTSILPEGENRCLIEGFFRMQSPAFTALLEENDIPPDDITIIRREVFASGKSRAFVNDTPVNLTLLKTLGDLLIDVHSQYDTLLLRDADYQMEVLDQFAGNMELLDTYQKQYLTLGKNREYLTFLKDKESKAKLEQDFQQHLFQELEHAALGDNEQESLENELNILSNAGEIKNILFQLLEILDNGDKTILTDLNNVQQLFRRICSLNPSLQDKAERIDDMYIEIKEIARELDHLSNHISHDPGRMEWVQQRLDLIYQLQKKHKVNDVQALNHIRLELKQQLASLYSLDHEISQLEKQLQAEEIQLDRHAKTLTASRMRVKEAVKEQLLAMIRQMGMPDGRFDILISDLQEAGPSGRDRVQFLFSANKGTSPGEISRMASGGELSRLMLAIKSMTGSQRLLPTMIFDEIDIGISGETASKIGQILVNLASRKQLIVITHLPQIAGRAAHHYLVFKESGENQTKTCVKLLNETERIREIAQMISGEAFSEKTLDTARELMGNN
ncbi:MAG TPA: DNA repair protein RecN [Bacteroidales bacterium]|nr:DNA repair protein RecN [Bacteroidales bacterium]HSA42684.1 DNA repair protein RecN [Bacteroidales bacterium]